MVEWCDTWLARPGYIYQYIQQTENKKRIFQITFVYIWLNLRFNIMYSFINIPFYIAHERRTHNGRLHSRWWLNRTDSNVSNTARSLNTLKDTLHPAIFRTHFHRKGSRIAKTEISGQANGYVRENHGISNRQRIARSLF